MSYKATDQSGAARRPYFDWQRTGSLAPFIVVQVAACLTETYDVELAPIRMRYRRAYGSSEGVIRMRLQGPEPSGRSTDLTYTFWVSLPPRCGEWHGPPPEPR